jgi:hypothetical protein
VGGHACIALYHPPITLLQNQPREAMLCIITNGSCWQATTHPSLCKSLVIGLVLLFVKHAHFGHSHVA